MTESTTGPSRPEGDTGGGRSARGPATDVPGASEPGGAVPPYEGRRQSADTEQEGGARRDGVRVGGATGPVEADDVEAPSGTPGDRTASPADEQPASDSADGRSAEQGVDTTSHVPGVPKGERGGA